ncbi:MAG: hypothetical protein E7129_03685 [Rikenellaceae bacterium]|nr:hypothetical protein [Rikenellaceae bacterium]
MRRFCEILFVVLLPVCMWACNSWSGYKADDEMVARVGTAYLYRSELAAAMPRGIDKQDSVNYSQAFISKWIVGQLKQQEAEKLFSQSESDIDRLVEEYRRSLLVHRLDKYFLEAEPCGEITAKDIAAYYNAHKSDFRITHPMVKGEIFAMDEKFRRREQMLKWFDSSKQEHREDFAELCRKNNLLHLQFDEWVSFSDFLSNLPLLRTSRHEELLGSRKIQKIQHNKTLYYFRITNALKVGDTMPLDMVEENIRQILINRHRADVIHRQEERIKNNALSSGHAKIYNQTENEKQKTEN